jgi:DNA-binding CsgD family transcriptional regulator
MTDNLERGREHHGRRRWSAACDDLTAADASEELALEDLELLASAAYLTGRHAVSCEAWARAHQGYLRAEDPARAARCAFWLWFGHMNRGEMAHAMGWLERGKAVLEEHPLDCVEQGYLRLPEAVGGMYAGMSAAVYPEFCEVAGIAERFADVDLDTLSRLARGQCLVFLGQRDEGVRLLDDVMIAVTTGEVSPAIVGMTYCAVIEACHGLLDISRAREWTIALTRWCDAQPDLVPYRGQCLVHRAELMQLHGEWPDAVVEAERAEEWLSQPPAHPITGLACYQQGEVHRLRGDVEKAEEAYRHASKWGHPVQPGLALLRLAQGQVDAAASSLRAVLDELGEPGATARLAAASVDVMLAADDVAGARRCADELAALARDLDAAFVSGLAAHALGAVLLAEADPRGAVNALRSAWSVWRDLDVPYEGARARALLGLAYRMLGDEDSAAMELDAAGWVFQELGAAPDLARLQALSTTGGPDSSGGHRLTGREIEVLRHLATGSTNRAIAAELVISEKTVARHVANIFTKLGLSSRAGATAYAYEHKLL